MHSVTIWFGPAAAVTTLLFKNENRAAETFDFLSGEAKSAVLSDEFGQRIFVRLGDINALLLEDMTLSVDAKVEAALYTARGQAKAETRAKEDPVLLAAARSRNQGPAVYTPGGMNGRA